MCLVSEVYFHVMKLKRVALIAHDGKKDELVEFVKRHEAWFSQRNWWAPGRPAVGSSPWSRRGTSGFGAPRRGAVAARITEGHLDAVMFFRDPWASTPTSQT